MDPVYYGLAGIIGTLVGCRLAYGSWPWEARKTWLWTCEEIEYLRAVQENNRLEKEEQR